MRVTKRPQNICESCGYTWFPRGKNVSLVCPRCGSNAVNLFSIVLLRQLLLIIAVPFLLIAMAFLWIGRLVAGLVRRAGEGAIAGASGEDEPPEDTKYKYHQPSPAAEIGFAIGKAFAGVASWFWSIKDDLSGDPERDVNPFELLAKLIILISLTMILIVVIIRQFKR